MQTSTAVMGTIIPRLEKFRKAVPPLCYAAVGFVLGGASILSVCAPFGVAWAALAPSALSIYASAGAIAGYAVLLQGNGSLRYLAAVLLLMGLRWAFAFLEERRLQTLLPWMGVVAIGVTGLAVSLPTAALMDYLMIGCEMLLVLSCSVLFARAARAAQSASPFSASGGLCLGILLAVLYMGLSSFTVMGASPARIAAVWMILTAAVFSGAGMAAVICAACGLAAAFAGQVPVFTATVACGLAAGMFAPLGRICVIAAGAIASVMGLIASGGGGMLPAHASELIVASLLAAVTTPSFVRMLGITAPCDLMQGELFRRAVSSRLRRTQNTLSEIAEVTGEVSKKLERIKCDPLDKFVSRAADICCKGCIDSPRCWQSGYSVTNDCFHKLFATARSGRTLAEEDIPERLLCRYPDKLCSAVNGQAAQYLGRQQSKQNASQLRTIVSDQFEAMALLLGSIEGDVRRLTPMTPAKTNAVTKYLEDHGAIKDGVCCALDMQGRAVITSAHLTKKLLREDIVALTVGLSELCAHDLGMPEQLASDDTTMLWWTSRGNFSLSCDWVQHAAGAQRLCGDSVYYQEESQGRSILLLSDGMGVGTAAAVDSTMTTSLVGRMLRAGCSFEAALRMVNSSLLSFGEERLCTVDAAVFDLFTGRVDFYKAGAAPSFVIRKGRVLTVDATALPAGILGGAECRKTTLDLCDGDIFVLLSDGVTDTGIEWIPSQLLALAPQGSKAICDGLLEVARQRRIDGREDDMTVMTAKVSLA